METEFLALRPCPSPFCEFSDPYVTYHKHDEDRWYAACTCGMEGPTKDSEQAAADAWNQGIDAAVFAKRPA